MASSIDFRQCLNAISDVVTNRPLPLREFDQIFMKTADMLLQTELVGRRFDGRDVVFIGDGDAIGLCLVHLHSSKLLPHGPKSVHVMDFDERVVLSVRRFAEQFDVEDRVTSELYNVAEPLPRNHWQRYGGFYTNPPFGKNNGGKSVEAFIKRGIEATGKNACASIVIADDPDYDWTQDVLRSTQQMLLNADFVISEVLPEFHSYHLDDVPDLTSCSIIARRLTFESAAYDSAPLAPAELAEFYGKENPLRIKYVRDKTNGGKLPSRDHIFEPYAE